MEAGLTEKLFNPAIWANRIEEMKKLWEQIPEYGKTQVRFPGTGPSEHPEMLYPFIFPKSKRSQLFVFVRHRAERGLVIGMSVEDIEAWPERIGAVTAAAVNAAAQAVLSGDASMTTQLLPEDAKSEKGDG